MQTTISHHYSEFTMAIVYDKKSAQYKLQFTSTRDNRSQEYTCSSYVDAVQRFSKNCRFYGVPVPVPPTEEEFLGLEPGTLYPVTQVTRSMYA